MSLSMGRVQNGSKRYLRDGIFVAVALMFVRPLLASYSPLIQVLILALCLQAVFLHGKMKYWSSAYLVGWIVTLCLVGSHFEETPVLAILLISGIGILATRVGRKARK